MPGYYVLQIPTEELKEHAVLTLLEYFISDCRVLVEKGESEAHSIAKSKNILFEHISEPQKLSTILSRDEKIQEAIQKLTQYCANVKEILDYYQ